MARQRCKETAMDSFFGHFLYQQKVPEGHFLRKLNEIIDWGRFTKLPSLTGENIVKALGKTASLSLPAPVKAFSQT